MELHHIIAVSDGGQDNIDNCIPLCLDCHAEVRAYDPKHPKGRRFTPSELRRHRDNWFRKMVESGELQTDVPDYLESDRKTYQDFMAHLPSDGSIVKVFSNPSVGTMAFSWCVFGEVDEFLAWARRVDMEFLDEDLESMRSNLLSLLSQYSWYLAGNTWLWKNGTDLTSIPEEWEYEQPERYLAVTQRIEAFAGAFATQYGDLVRTARRKLAF